MRNTAVKSGLTPEEIGKIVQDVLSQSFDNLEIATVHVREETDDQGDEILRVFVVFNGSQKDKDVSQLSGIVREVRPKLRDSGVTAFPLFSFLSKKDAGTLKLATA